MKIQEEIEPYLKLDFLPDDLLNKGSKMSEAYILLYLIENSLRFFIETVLKTKAGDDFSVSTYISRDILKRVLSRKEDEKKNKWLSIRGSSDIFYMDFEDLSKVIVNNWDIFNEYFPKMDFITSKIKELAKCRNLIAHNSYLAKLDFNMIKTYYQMIIQQISKNV